MGLFFGKKEEERAEEVKELNENAIEDGLLKAFLSSGSVLSRDEAMQIPAVSACVRLICDTVAMIPFKLYKYDAESTQLEEITNDPRVAMINVDTGDTLDAVQFKKALIEDYLLDKGGYAYIERRGNRVKSLRYVDTAYVAFNYNADPIFKEYMIEVNGGSYAPYEFLKILRNSKDGQQGRGIIEENAAPLMVAWRITQFQDRLIKTGGNKKGFVKSQRPIKADAIKALKDAWTRMYSENTENVVILNDGLEFQESSESSTEMQINETVNTLTHQIAQVFGVPTSLLSGASTDTAAKGDRVTFIQYCIQPILTEFENALNRDLLLEKEKGVYKWAADTSELTKADILERYRAYEIACKNGFMQIDEVRYKENSKPLGLDFVKLGLQDVLYYPENGLTFLPNMNQVGGIDLAMKDREMVKEKQRAEIEAIKRGIRNENRNKK